MMTKHSQWPGIELTKVSGNIVVDANSFMASGGTLYMKSAKTLQKITFIFLRWARGNIFNYCKNYQRLKTKISFETKINQGRTNPFVLSRVYDVEWVCEYDMRWWVIWSQSLFFIGAPIWHTVPSYCSWYIQSGIRLTPSLAWWCLSVRGTLESLFNSSLSILSILDQRI